MAKHHYDANKVKEYVKDIIVKSGIPEKKAKISADVLVEADMRGIGSHGVNNLDLYVLSSIGEGGIDPNVEPEVIPTSFPNIPIRHVDAKGDLGHLAAMFAVDLVKELARKYGIGKVYVFNANHFGAAGIYSEEIAKDKDLAGRVTSTTPAIVVPYGGNKVRLGTNLVSWSIPYDEGIATIDMASTVHAASGIFKALVEKTDLPFPVYDRNGKLTMNSADFADREDFLRNGAMAPLGGLGAGQGPKGDAGYKGTGLAFLIELDNVIAGGASGIVSALVHDDKTWIRQTFEAYRIDTRFPRQKALEEISNTVRDIRSYGGPGMLIPGEKEAKARQDAIAHGILYEDVQVDRLEAAAKKVGMGRLQPIP